MHRRDEDADITDGQKQLILGENAAQVLNLER